MPWRRKRGLGFFPGLVVGTVLGVGASAVFGSELYDGARSLQQEELRWRARAIEITSQARTQAEILFAQTESDFRAQLSSFTDGFIPDGNTSAEN